MLVSTLSWEMPAGLGVLNLCQHVGGQRLLNDFGADAVKVNRSGEVILHRLRLHGVGAAEFLDDL
jgi:hypothetical protein